MLNYLVFTLLGPAATHAGWFAAAAAPPRDPVVARVHLTPGRGLALRAADEAPLRTFASASLGLGPAVVLGRADRDFALDLALFAPGVNAGWLAKLGPVRILPDERGGLSVSAETCAEVDRAGLLLKRFAGVRTTAQSFESSAHACRMDVTRALPERVAETLGQIRADVNGPNAALYALGLANRPARTGARELRDVLDRRCHRRAGAAELGDLVVIFDRAPTRGPATPLHAYVHLADDLAFEKPGRASVEPYWFTPAARILDAYEVGPLDQFPAKPSGVGRRYALAYACVP